jgi:hypothetical protein
MRPPSLEQDQILLCLFALPHDPVPKSLQLFGIMLERPDLRRAVFPRFIAGNLSNKEILFDKALQAV